MTLIEFCKYQLSVRPADYLSLYRTGMSRVHAADLVWASVMRHPSLVAATACHYGLATRINSVSVLLQSKMVRLLTIVALVSAHLPNCHSSC